MGTNGLALFCEATNEWHAQLMPWGNNVIKDCPSSEKVCGFQAKVLPYQGIFNDDVGIAEMNIRCCLEGNTQSTDLLILHAATLLQKFDAIPASTFF